jgi:hypothetical protein
MRPGISGRTFIPIDKFVLKVHSRCDLVSGAGQHIAEYAVPHGLGRVEVVLHGVSLAGDRAANDRHRIYRDGSGSCDVAARDQAAGCDRFRHLYAGVRPGRSSTFWGTRA